MTDTHLDDEEKVISEPSEMLNPSISEVFDKSHHPLAHSPHFSDYDRELNYSMRAGRRKQLLRKLATNQIYYQEEQLGLQEMETFNFSHSQHYEIITFSVLLQRYNLHLNLINVASQSPFHCFSPYSFGNFGQVYPYLTYSGHHLAVKCIPIQKENFHSQLKRVINQCCLAKIAAAVQCGPRLPQKTFDIMVYEDCIEFQTQVCYPKPTLDLLEQQNLRQSLLDLHLLNVVHSDLKLEHVMYSYNFKKCVFLDFGLASVLAQPIGYTTPTHFKGSLKYASPDMAELCYENSKKEVDMYWNDFYGLQRIFQEKQGETGECDLREGKNGYNLREVTESVWKDMLMLRFKFSVYFEQISDIRQLYDLIQWQKIEKEIVLCFMEEIFFIKRHIKEIFLKALCFVSEDESNSFFLKNKTSNQLLNTPNKESLQFSTRNPTLEIRNRAMFRMLQYLEKNYDKETYYLWIKQTMKFNILQKEESKVSSKFVSILSDPQRRHFCGDEEYYQYLLNALNFRTKTINISFEDKVKICQSFEKYYLKSDVSLHPVDSVKKCVLFLFRYCSQQAYNSWKLNNISEIFCQCLILDALSFDEILDYFQMISKMSNIVLLSCKLFFESYFNTEWLRIIILKGKEYRSYELKRRLFIQADELINQLRNRYYQSRHFYMDVHFYCQQEQDKQKHITINPEQYCQFSLLKMLFFINQELRETYYHSGVSCYLQDRPFLLKANMRQHELSISPQKIIKHLSHNSIPSRFSDCLIFVHIANMHEEYLQISNKIISLIDCPQISQKFTFSFYSSILNEIKDCKQGSQSSDFVKLLQNLRQHLKTSPKNERMLIYLFQIKGSTVLRDDGFEYSKQYFDYVMGCNLQTYQPLKVIDILNRCVKPLIQNEEQLLFNEILEIQICKFDMAEIAEILLMNDHSISVFYQMKWSNKDMQNRIFDEYEKKLKSSSNYCPILASFKAFVFKLEMKNRTKKALSIGQIYDLIEQSKKFSPYKFNTVTVFNQFLYNQFFSLKQHEQNKLNFLCRQIIELNQYFSELAVFIVAFRAPQILVFVLVGLLKNRQYDVAHIILMDVFNHLNDQFKHSEYFYIHKLLVILYQLFHNEQNEYRWFEFQKILLRKAPKTWQNPYYFLFYLQILDFRTTACIRERRYLLQPQLIVQLLSRVASSINFLSIQIKGEVIFEYYEYFIINFNTSIQKKRKECRLVYMFLRLGELYSVNSQRYEKWIEHLKKKVKIYILSQRKPIQEMLLAKLEKRYEILRRNSIKVSRRKRRIEFCQEGSLF